MWPLTYGKTPGREGPLSLTVACLTCPEHDHTPYMARRKNEQDDVTDTVDWLESVITTLIGQFSQRTVCSRLRSGTEWNQVTFRMNEASNRKQQRRLVYNGTKVNLESPENKRQKCKEPKYKRGGEVIVRLQQKLWSWFWFVFFRLSGLWLLPQVCVLGPLRWSWEGSGEGDPVCPFTRTARLAALKNYQVMSGKPVGRVELA